MKKFAIHTAFGLVTLELTEKEMDKSYKLSEIEDQLAHRVYGMTVDSYRKARQFKESLKSAEVQCSGITQKGTRCRNRITLFYESQNPRIIVKEFESAHFCQFHC